MMHPTESRYSRQSRFAPLGPEGQERIRAASVAIIGCGALGTVEAEILVRAGVGRLRIIDRDFVEWSNLQRQFLFEESDAAEGLPKAVAAARRLARVNSEVAIEPLVADLIPANIEELLEGVGLILDGTDNFEARFLINDYAVSSGIPWIYAAAVGSYGLKLAIVPAHGVPAVRLSRASRRVAAHVRDRRRAGACDSGHRRPRHRRRPEAARARSGSRDGAADHQWMFGPGEIRQTSPPARDPDCPCCARREFVHLTGQRRAPISLCGRNAVQIHERFRPVDLADLARRLAPLATVRANDFAVRASIEPYELTVFPDGRAIIKGTTDPAVARSLYARYVGN